MFRYILASASPRRYELLQKIIGEFSVIPPHADERFDESLPPEKVCVMLAERKDGGFRALPDDVVIIAADTIVYKDGKYYGKPADGAEAAAHLTALRDSKHTVYTGVAVKRGNIMFSGYQKTRVIFGAFPDKMIYNYIAERHPFDKAGAYGVQDIEGYCKVKYLGDYDNVMGLPLGLTKKLIKKCENKKLRQR